MKIATTSERLKELMSERNLRQIDIIHAAKPFCEKYGVKLSKTDLSQYVSGKVEPGQEKLSILGLTLNVNEAWLMGYDVSSSRDIHYSREELIDVYMRGAKKWASDFRFTSEQSGRIIDYLVESGSRQKTVIENMANSVSDGKILMNPALQAALNDISRWTANAVRYVNNDYSDDPFDEWNIIEQYLAVISKLSRRDQVAWLIRLQDYIEDIATKEETP